VAQTLEIGRSLREARLARGLALEALEGRTKIRARYLAALEEERFGELPGDAYTRGFLRTYADELGLDGQELVGLYRARVRAQEELAVAPRPQRPYEPARLWPALAGLGAALVLVVSSLVAWQLGGDETVPPAQPVAEPPAPTRAQPSTPTSVSVVATAPTQVQIRFGGPTGRRVWSGTLRPGLRPLRLGLSHPLWLRAETPGRVRLLLGGERRRLPATTVRINPGGVAAA
jgi:cytoskeleton protein RodZ